MKRQLLNCPHCGAKMAFERPECLRCGRKIVRERVPDTTAADQATKRRRIQMGAAAVGVLIAAAGVIGLIGRARTVEAVPSTVLLAARTAAVTVQDDDAEIVSVATTKPAEVAPEPAAAAASAAGYAAFQAGDYGTALARFQEALSRNPNDADTLNNAGQVLVELNRAPEAVSYLERAIVARPSDHAAKFNLAVALARSGNSERAATAYREVIAQKPNDLRAHHNLGLVLRQLGRDEEAVQAFQKATSLDQEEAPAWLGLALSLDRLNRRDEAAQAYERYVGLDPSNPEVPRMRERIGQLRKNAGSEDPASIS